MDPLILQKLNSKGKRSRHLGYDQKADIWSLGAICYEMLIGKAAFDADDMRDLVNKIETGKYKVPTTLSKEVISFLNGMLQYNSKTRLDINQLAVHPFITKNIKEFHLIDLKQVSNKLDNTKTNIVIDVKKNKSIWAIFNKEDEDKLIKISPGYLTPINEANEDIQDKRNNQENNPYLQRKDNKIFMNNMNNMNNINNINMMNQGYNNNNYSNYPQSGYYGPILPSPNQGIPGNPIYQNSNLPKMQMPIGIENISAAPTMESHYIYSGGIYK